ncbi:MAG: holo-ACP synthase [Lachnospiraceae bacterium]|jgi:holo-[acyl-carrier protein] synthase
MIRGTGIDLVQIERIRRAQSRNGGAFIQKGFTLKEQEYAESGPDPAVRYAGLYAVKEAVYKAVAPNTAAHDFDIRLVETGHRPDGSPYVIVNERLQAVLDEAGIRRLHISITDEGEYAAAFAVAEG